MCRFVLFGKARAICGSLVSSFRPTVDTRGRHVPCPQDTDQQLWDAAKSRRDGESELPDCITVWPSIWARGSGRVVERDRGEIEVVGGGRIVFRDCTRGRLITLLNSLVHWSMPARACSAWDTWITVVREDVTGEVFVASSGESGMIGVVPVLLDGSRKGMRGNDDKNSCRNSVSKSIAWSTVTGLAPRQNNHSRYLPWPTAQLNEPNQKCKNVYFFSTKNFKADL